MISRTKEFVKISNIMGPSQNPKVKGLLGLAPVQPCDNGLIIPVEDFLGRFPYPARRGVIARRVTTKQSHLWDRPAPRGTAYVGMTTGGTPMPAEIASSLSPRKNNQPRQPLKSDLMANSDKFWQCSMLKQKGTEKYAP